MRRTWWVSVIVAVCMLVVLFVKAPDGAAAFMLMSAWWSMVLTIGWYQYRANSEKQRELYRLRVERRLYRIRRTQQRAAEQHERELLNSAREQMYGRMTYPSAMPPPTPPNNAPDHEWMRQWSQWESQYETGD